MKKFVLGKDVVIIYFDFSYELVDAVKELPKRGWRPELRGKPWEAALVPENVKPLFRLARRYGFRVPDSVTKALNDVTKKHKANMAISGAVTGKGVEVEGLGGELKNFQKIGVRYITDNERVLLGDQTGLGKTIEALAAIQKLDAYPALIVCPSSLKRNWKKEAEKWLPKTKTVEILESRSTYKYNADVVIINYAIVDWWKDNLQGFKIAIADESHYLKNNDALRSEACLEIFQQVKYRLLLSATPIENRPKELVHQLKILGRIKMFGGAWNFLQTYCDSKKGYFGWEHNGATNTDELHQKLRSTCYLRRTKDQVMSELPPVQRSMLPVDIDNRREYEEVAATVRDYLAERARERVLEDESFLQTIAGLPENEQAAKKLNRQANVYRRSLYAEALVKIERLKQASARGKLSLIKQWVYNFLESGEKVILFATHRDIIKSLADEFDAPMIVGGQPSEVTEEAKEKFQNDDDTKVLVCNIKAGGVGHTLTAATNVVFAELPWTPTAVLQAIDRAYGRLNDPHGVNAWFFVGKDTVDEKIFDLLEEKRGIVASVTDGKEEVEDISVEKEIFEALLAEVMG